MRSLLVDALRPLAKKQPAPDVSTLSIPQAESLPVAPGDDSAGAAARLLETLREQSAGASRVEGITRAFPGASTSGMQFPEAVAAMFAKQARPPGPVPGGGASQVTPLAAAGSAPQYYFMPAARSLGCGVSRSSVV